MSEKKKFFLCLIFAWILFFLCGCSTHTPSSAITDATIIEIKTVQKQLDTLKGCDTTHIKEQLTGISKQVDNIRLSCQTEKSVLEKDIQMRNGAILILLILIASYIIVKVRVIR